MQSFYISSFIKQKVSHVMNETELVKRCGKGDTLARKQLYERYAGQLLAVCIRYTGDREVAQDILHDSFLNVFRSIGHFVYQGEGSLKAWLHRIVVNEALGYLRQQAVSLSHEVGMDDIPDVEDSEEDDWETIPPKVILQFVQELPSGYRTVVNLYVFEEKGHKEIARLLGISEHSSSSQLSRARALLMKKVNQYRKQMRR